MVVGQLVVGLKSVSLMSMQSVCVSASTTVEVLELDDLEHLDPLGEPELVRWGLFLQATDAESVVVVVWVTESVAGFKVA